MPLMSATTSNPITKSPADSRAAHNAHRHRRCGSIGLEGVRMHSEARHSGRWRGRRRDKLSSRLHLDVAYWQFVGRIAATFGSA